MKTSPAFVWERTAVPFSQTPTPREIRASNTKFPRGGTQLIPNEGPRYVLDPLTYPFGYVRFGAFSTGTFTWLRARIPPTLNLSVEEEELRGKYPSAPISNPERPRAFWVSSDRVYPSRIDSLRSRKLWVTTAVLAAVVMLAAFRAFPERCCHAFSAWPPPAKPAAFAAGLAVWAAAIAHRRWIVSRRPASPHHRMVVVSRSRTAIASTRWRVPAESTAVHPPGQYQKACPMGRRLPSPSSRPAGAVCPTVTQVTSTCVATLAVAEMVNLPSPFEVSRGSLPFVYAPLRTETSQLPSPKGLSSCIFHPTRARRGRVGWAVGAA